MLSVLLCAALPATAQAGRDPLLSGYGGPGSGEQVILGAKLLPPGGGGGGGGGSAAAATSLRVPSTATGSASAAAPGTAATGPAARTGGKSGTGGKAAARKRHRDKLGVATAEIQPARSAAPPVVPYPTRASDAGGVLSFGDGLLLALGALALILVALGLKRLVAASDPPGEGIAR